MKVLVVCPYSWATPGGVGAHVANLADALRVRGHEVRIVAPDAAEAPGVISVGRSIPIPYNGSIARLAFGPRVAMRVRVAIRRYRPDVIHVHEPFAPSVSLATLLSTRRPVVATFHASAPRSRAYRLASPPLRPLYRRLAGRIAVSDEARRTVESVLGDGLRVIPNGVNVSLFAGLAEPSGSAVLFIGRFEPRKGARVLIDAFPALKRLRPDATLIMVGEGSERRACEQAVPDDLRDDVTFVGRVEPWELAQAMGEAAVVAVPSLGGESFGIVLLEGMAAGRPVVASNIPGYAAVLRDGVDGLLVPPGDAPALAAGLASILGDPERGRSMGRAGRQRAGRYDWAVVAGEIEAVYTEAVEGAQRGRRKPR
ncbi:MAG TPA: glycosyltransferase family 4 protein [Actinomycetota bacterium]|nr:glycosyltransferase family 4 protein [Actinomycetota bacterium]